MVYYFVPYNDAQTILSVVGCILSLIALALTFIVYSLLPSLRTLPGKSIMSLTVALFAAQFILTFGAGQTNNSIICTLIAVAMHFFWLASFFWMSVLAYDISKTFNNTHNRSKEINRKSFTNYSTTAWGTPFVIVTICFVFSLNVKSLDFDYGSPFVCWISNNVASLIIFGGPVLSSVCLNIILFGLTVHGVRGTMKTSSTLRSSRSTSHSTCSEIKIYVKITSLMGFSWFFGFVATFTGAEILWYFFIVLCSLQVKENFRKMNRTDGIGSEKGFPRPTLLVEATTEREKLRMYLAGPGPECFWRKGKMIKEVELHRTHVKSAVRN
ncbi:latrophilin receptor-like protein A [Antedon mediterranea]|uniref:latrophilin receptor-like protein A n=1 Tax=Antedon mediterranea TaxID=105859 RepID=UPI003AF52FC8